MPQLSGHTLFGDADDQSTDSGSPTYAALTKARKESATPTSSAPGPRATTGHSLLPFIREVSKNSVMSQPSLAIGTNASGCRAYRRIWRLTLGCVTTSAARHRWPAWKAARKRHREPEDTQRQSARETADSCWETGRQVHARLHRRSRTMLDLRSPCPPVSAEESQELSRNYSSPASPNMVLCDITVAKTETRKYGIVYRTKISAPKASPAFGARR